MYVYIINVYVCVCVCVKERAKGREKEKCQFIFNEAPTCSLAQEFLFMGHFHAKVGIYKLSQL